MTISSSSRASRRSRFLRTWVFYCNDVDDDEDDGHDHDGDGGGDGDDEDGGGGDDYKLLSTT